MKTQAQHGPGAAGDASAPGARVPFASKGANPGRFSTVVTLTLASKSKVKIYLKYISFQILLVRGFAAKRFSLEGK